MKGQLKKTTALIALVLLTGCPKEDMQGNDPREFYAEHPIKNTVESRDKIVTVHYEAGAERLSPSQVDRLEDALHPVSMLAISSVQLTFSPHDTDAARKLHLRKLIRNLGYDKDVYVVKTSSNVRPDYVTIDFTYSVVISPDCPDWRTSPVTTFSNSTQGNFNCANEVNTGAMVADPHDLVRGTGDVEINTNSATKALQDYNEGRIGSTPNTSSGTPGTAGSSGSSSTSSGGSSGAGSTPSQ